VRVQPVGTENREKNSPVTDDMAGGGHIRSKKKKIFPGKQWFKDGALSLLRLTFARERQEKLRKN